MIKNVVKTLGKKKFDIKYLTVTTSASCLVGVDENCNPLFDAMMVSDSRSKSEINKIKSLKEFKLISNETNMGCTPDLMAPKISWILKNKPKVYKKTKKFLNVGDFLNALLTGRYLTDINNAFKFY